MKVTRDTIDNLLSDDMVYKIPRYQRQYSWQVSPQCSTLWDDVAELIELNKNNAAASINHFLGTIVAVNIEDDAVDLYEDDAARQHLIDGQQRVTSICLLVIALRYYVMKQLDKEPSDKLEELYILLTGMLQRASGQPKLELSSVDQSAYLELLNGYALDVKPQPKTKGQAKESLLIKNCRYFYDRWKELFARNSFELSERTIKPMFERLQFARITLSLDDKDNPQQVFESLNSTGLGLSQTDLIRNFLLMEMDVERQRKLYADYWCKLEQNIDQHVTSEQDSADYMMLFFMHFLTVQNADIPKKDKLYLIFKDWFKKTYQNADGANQTCLETLLEANQVWCDIYWSNESATRVESICYELRQLERGVLNPLILKFLYDHRLGRINEQTLLVALKFLRSYILRLFIQNDDVANLMNGSFCQLIDKINKAQQGELSDEQYLQILLDHLCKEVSLESGRSKSRFKLKCPTDSEFKHSLIHHSFDISIQDRRYAKMMLFVTERYHNKEFSLLPKEFELDFILPSNHKLLKQDVNQGWEQSLKTLAEHQKWYGRLGNLTLHQNRALTKSSSKWATFAARKAELGQNYKHHLNLELQPDQAKDEWTIEDIKARGERLADLILKVLPYPDMSLVDAKD